MKVIKYQDKHFKYIDSWVHGHHHEILSPTELPHHGFVAIEDEKPLAAGFVRMCDGDLSFIEGYITDPQASTRKRSKAIDKITIKLIDLAQRRGKKKMVGWTKNRSVVKRSRQFGFKTIDGYQVIAARI